MLEVGESVFFRVESPKVVHASMESLIGKNMWAALIELNGLKKKDMKLGERHGKGGSKRS